MKRPSDQVKLLFFGLLRTVSALASTSSWSEPAHHAAASSSASSASAAAAAAAAATASSASAALNAYWDPRPHYIVQQHQQQHPYEQQQQQQQLLLRGCPVPPTSSTSVVQQQPQPQQAQPQPQQQQPWYQPLPQQPPPFFLPRKQQQQQQQGETEITAAELPSYHNPQGLVHAVDTSTWRMSSPACGLASSSSSSALSASPESPIAATTTGTTSMVVTATLRLARRTDVSAIQRVNLASLPENYNAAFYSTHLRQWPDLALVVVDEGRSGCRGSSFPIANHNNINHNHHHMDSGGEDAPVIAYVLGKIEEELIPCWETSTSTGSTMSLSSSTARYTTRKFGHVTSLAVDDEYRRLGLAQALMQQLHCHLINQGIQEVGLHVRQSNHAAAQLYSNFGYIQAQTIPHYYQDGEDAYYMVKTLLSNNQSPAQSWSQRRHYPQEQQQQQHTGGFLSRAFQQRRNNDNNNNNNNNNNNGSWENGSGSDNGAVGSFVLGSDEDPNSDGAGWRLPRTARIQRKSSPASSLSSPAERSSSSSTTQEQDVSLGWASTYNPQQQSRYHQHQHHQRSSQNHANKSIGSSGDLLTGTL